MAVKERIMEISTLLEGMAECVDYIYEGLSAGDIRALEKAECAMEGGRDLATSLTEAMVRESAEDPGARRYVSIPSHIDRMQENMGRIAGGVRKQINRKHTLQRQGCQ